MKLTNDFGSGALLHDFVRCGELPEALTEKYRGKLPAEILTVWQEYGLGTFYGGYLKVINPDDFQELVEKSYFRGAVSIPVFATAFGDLITWEKGQFVGIITYRYGDSDIMMAGFDFFFEDLRDGELDEEFFSIEQYQEAVQKYGALGYEECFGYVPLLALGGKESVEYLKKVKLKEHIALITELAGPV